MIIIKQGEELRRRFNAKVKGFGDGTFYVTSNRLCFETKKNGMCFDLDFEHLWNWEVKNSKKVKIQWQERKPGIAYSMEDEKLSIEVEFKKKDGKQPHIEDIIGSMYYAFTDKYIYGELGLGLQIDEKNQMFSRFNVGKPKAMTSQQLDGEFDTIQLIHMAKLENATGETLLDQERFKRFKMWQALDFDGYVYSKRSGIEHPSELLDPTEVEVEVSTGSIEFTEDLITKLREQVTTWEKEGNTKELEKLLPAWPNYNNGRIYIPRLARTTYEEIEIKIADTKIWKRAVDIISNKTFEFPKQSSKYYNELVNKITTKYLEGGDISNYTPIVEKIPSATIKAKQEIAEYRKKLTEKV